MPKSCGSVPKRQVFRPTARNAFVRRAEKKADADAVMRGVRETRLKDMSGAATGIGERVIPLIAH
jgi:hypothetical protein